METEDLKSNDNSDQTITHRKTAALARQHILRRSWFSRVWVLQELVLSPDPWIQAGTRRLRWHLFCRFLLRQNSPMRLQSDLKHLNDMDLARQTFGPQQKKTKLLSSRSRHDENIFFGENLLQMLLSRRGAGVTNPADMIYGHLGILGAGLKYGIPGDFLQINYSKSAHDVYEEVASYLIHLRERFVFLLLLVEEVPLEARLKGLPTWVPDWTVPQAFSGGLDIEEYSAGEGMVEQLDLRHKIFRNPTVLACIGHTIGVIGFIVHSMPPICDLSRLYEKAKSQILHVPDVNDIAIRMDRLIFELLEDWWGKTLPPGSHQIIPVKDEYSRVLSISDQPDRRERIARLSRIIATRSFPTLNKRHPRNPRENYDPIVAQRSYLLHFLLLGMIDQHGSAPFHGKRLAVLKDQSLALVPKHAKVGDQICFFNNSPAPFTLRGLSTSTCPSPEDSKTDLHNGQIDQLDLRISNWFDEKAMTSPGSENQVVLPGVFKGSLDPSYHATMSSSAYFDSNSDFEHDSDSDTGPGYLPLDTPEIEHYNFVGMSFLGYDLPFDEGWPRFVERRRKIFALH